MYREEFTGNALKLSATYDPGFIRFDAAWLGRAPGYSEVLTYERVEHDQNGQEAANGTRSHRFTVESLSESLALLAGDFEDCLRVRRTRVRDPGAELEEGDDDQFWFCPGIGKVREKDLVTGKTEELVSCTTPSGTCPDPEQ